MRIEGIITCVNYADFLAETLPRNLPFFDRVIVITSLEDKETQELCRRLSVTYYATDVFQKDGGFSKARGIDFAIPFCRHGDWIVHMDADTCLPPLARQMLGWKELDPEAIYGIDRVNCVGWDRWQKHLWAHHLGHDYQCRTPIPAGLPVCDRIALPEHGGYIPIGFFQLWHANTRRRYPISSNTAERDDVLHALQWPTFKRHLLPEIVAVHLESEPSELGANWGGRKTKRFEAPKPPIEKAALEKTAAAPGHTTIIERHRHHHFHCPPRHEPPKPYMKD